MGLGNSLKSTSVCCDACTVAELSHTRQMLSPNIAAEFTITGLGGQTGAIDSCTDLLVVMQTYGEKQDLQRHGERQCGARRKELLIHRLMENFVQHSSKPNLPERSDTSRAPGVTIMCGVRANALTGMHDLISCTKKIDGGRASGWHSPSFPTAKLIWRGFRLCLNQTILYIMTMEVFNLPCNLHQTT